MVASAAATTAPPPGNAPFRGATDSLRARDAGSSDEGEQDAPGQRGRVAGPDPDPEDGDPPVERLRDPEPPEGKPERPAGSAFHAGSAGRLAEKLSTQKRRGNAFLLPRHGWRYGRSRRDTGRR